MEADSEQAQLDVVAHRLEVRFHELPTEVVAAAVGDAQEDLRAAAIRDFVPLLVEKEARDRLEAVARQRRGTNGT